MHNVIYLQIKCLKCPKCLSIRKGTESYQQFAIRIAEMLLQPEKFRELYQS